MSTAVTARDMLSIVNAFAETEDGGRASKPSELLNYYGISYGKSDSAHKMLVLGITYKLSSLLLQNSRKAHIN
jgi:hypothetical protein